MREGERERVGETKRGERKRGREGFQVLDLKAAGAPGHGFSRGVQPCRKEGMTPRNKPSAERGGPYSRVDRWSFSGYLALAPQ